MEQRPIEIFEIFHHIAQPCDLVITIVALGICNQQCYKFFNRLMVRFPELARAHKTHPRAIKPSNALLKQYVINDIVTNFAIGEISLNYIIAFKQYYKGITCAIDNPKLIDFIEHVMLSGSNDAQICANISHISRFKSTYQCADTEAVFDKLYGMFNIRFSWLSMMRFTLAAIYAGQSESVIRKLWQYNYRRIDEKWKITESMHNMKSAISGFINRQYGDIDYLSLQKGWLDIACDDKYKPVRDYLYKD
ncbi:hypothetical protein PRJ_Dakar_00307 [Faustovirus]|nr:hypothetical protein PRJ_Dakar_00307 [Faustovirus]